MVLNGNYPEEKTVVVYDQNEIIRHAVNTYYDLNILVTYALELENIKVFATSNNTRDMLNPMLSRFGNFGYPTIHI